MVYKKFCYNYCFDCRELTEQKTTPRINIPFFFECQSNKIFVYVDYEMYNNRF